MPRLSASACDKERNKHGKEPKGAPKVEKSASGYITKRFKFQDEVDFLKEITNRCFDTQEEFQKRVIDVLNDITKPLRLRGLRNSQGEPLYIFHKTDSYVQVKCRVCKNFQVWFNYSDSKVNTLTNIKLKRTINLGHLKVPHEGVNLDMPGIVFGDYKPSANNRESYSAVSKTVMTAAAKKQSAELTGLGAFKKKPHSAVSQGVHHKSKTDDESSEFDLDEELEFDER